MFFNSTLLQNAVVLALQNRLLAAKPPSTKTEKMISGLRFGSTRFEVGGPGEGEAAGNAERACTVQKSKAILSFVVIQAMSVSLFAANVEDIHGPIPASVSPCATDPDMSLGLYRSLREKALKLADAQQTVPSEINADIAAQPDPTAILMSLADEVREHEGEILCSLSSTRSIQRELAARVLALAADKKSAMNALCVVLAEDADADVRVTAAFTLGRIGDAGAVESLLKGLKDENENVRAQSIGALGQIHDERAVADLLQVLRSDLKPLLRLQAASSLAKIKAGVNESDLSGLLESESDERVKMAIASAIRAVAPVKTPELAEVPDHDDYGKQLSDLSGVMKGVEQKMRDDRFDEIVQIDQNDIDEKLGDMIQELEKMQRTKMEQQQKESRQQQSKRRLATLGEGEEVSPRPRSASRPPPPPASHEERINSGRVVSRGDNWAALPEAERDELLQVFRPEVPLRWRKRLEAYFVSIAAEEAKSEKK